MKRLVTLVVLMAVALQVEAVPSSFGFVGGSFMQGPNVGTVVPDLTGLTVGAGTTALNGVGLIAGTTSTACSLVTSGLILSQNPAAGMSVTPGSAVDMVTSTGVACPPIRKTKMGIGNGFGFSP